MASLAACLLLFLLALSVPANGQPAADQQNPTFQEVQSYATKDAFYPLSSTSSSSVAAIPVLIWVIIGVLVLTVLTLAFALWWVIRRKLDSPGKK